MSSTAPSHGDDCTDLMPSAVADPVEFLSRFAEQNRTKFLGMARSWMRRFHIDAIGLSAEDAVNGAWVVLCQRIRSGSLPPIRSLELFDNAFIPILRQFLVDHFRQEHACKRPRMDRSRSGTAFVNIAAMKVSPGPPTDEQVLGKLHMEGLLTILDRQDSSLRTIMVLKMEGYSNEEVATNLHRSEKTVKRGLRKIRSILKPHLDEYA